MKNAYVVSLALAAAFAATVPAAKAQSSILNASYDVSRELYKEINPRFVADWKTTTGETVKVDQSHGGSSKQASSVLHGLKADVVTMNQATDIDLLANGGLVAKDWRDKFPHNASPYTTISVFLVRKGNPKDVKDWKDLIRDDVQVIVPNPKTSGNGRYTYIAAWGNTLLKGGTDADARAFVTKLFENVPVLDGGGRGATTTFTQRDIGDVLVTFENEAILIGKELGPDKFDIVYPSTSVEAAPPVAIVETVVDKHDSRKLAEAYLTYLYSPPAQEVIAKQNFRPRDPGVRKEYAAKFPEIETFDVEKLIGPWSDVQKTHFASGGMFDELIAHKGQ
ncbi:sulfate ABC transporter substrate-binding protein [Methyloceanibacter sp.]|uniref:sulfate ABC transporter substrate-binding protein n=1 Tax=Methyloceanibacter sp. TaxID=1965321 RepID=UPI002C7FE508|nr:sulfate ABC transporter substrate-binding protein [Methyloceanibacter sp.]HML91068.1 sulfate ABC transporter substrate-binding protein [Methyloceanibacter sp.]